MIMESPSISSTSPPTSETVLDPVQLQELRQLDGTGSLFTTLIDHFLRQVPDALDAIHQALLRGDASEVARVAHDLRGSSSNFGARQMVSLCREIQEFGEAGGLDRVGATFAQLRAAFQSVEQQLRVERERRIAGHQ